MSKDISLVYNDLITLQEGDDEGIPSVCRVRGVAFKSGVISKAGVLVPDKELDNVIRTLEGAPFLIDHSRSIRDVIGKVTGAWRDNQYVKFKGEIVDEEIATKVRQGLVNSVSVGLHVEDFEDIEIDGQALKKLNGITVKELSIVIFPAVDSATFEPSFEFSVVERDKDQLDEADIVAMQEILISRGKVVLDKKVYDEVKNNLDEIKERYATLEKVVWLYANCDSQFIEEMLPKINRFGEKELAFLWETYQNMSNFGSQGVVAGEQALNTTDSRKEAIRELIFGVRRDGAPIGKIRDIKDIK